jgi:hypothetical protein
MTYVLYKLAPGSYDLELDGELIGGVVRTVSPGETSWIAELLDPALDGEHPVPFTAPEHEFPTLEAVLQWLGSTDVRWRERQAA